MALEALLIGHNANLLRALPKLLARAGFKVDVITTATRFSPRDLVRDIAVTRDTKEMLAKAAAQVSHDYDLVVIGDDRALRNIIQSDLPDEIKLRLLPVCGVKDFSHIGTKIGLSQLLMQAGVITPEFWVVVSRDALVLLLESLSHTVMIKTDMSGGGVGVFKFEPGNSTAALLKKPIGFPVLVQNFIEGDLVDLSAFYQNGALVHFGYSQINKVVGNPFGPSSVRTYTQLAGVPEDVFTGLRALGNALGAHGFVNIACLRSFQDSKYYFIEADMRPTVWAAHSNYIGDDPASAIRKYFDQSAVLTYPQHLCKDYPLQRIIPYALRLTAIEMITNRHQVWRYCKEFSKQEIARHCLSSLVHSFKQMLVELIKPHVSAETLQRLRQLWQRATGRSNAT